METAAWLLRDTSLSVPMIAYLLGYSEPKPFRRIFVRWAGQLPADSAAA
jgi:transcriptional regulator GlxA family with amidase domain